MSVSDPPENEADVLESLVARAVGGDQAALEGLCHAVQGPVYRLSLRMLGTAQDAEDCTQEILVLMVTHLSQFDGRSKLFTWVYSIASRHLLRARRSRMEERAVTIPDVARIVELGLAQAEPVSLPAGEARLLARDVHRTCTQAMLLSLSREERLAVLLGDVLGATDVVGAGICEISPDAFRQRLARGRATLRPLLEEQCGLSNPSNPCRCVRQAKTKRALGMKLPVYQDAEEQTATLSRARTQLGTMARLGRVFAIEPPPAPRRELWRELVGHFPPIEVARMRQLTCSGPGRLEWRDVPPPTLASDEGALVRPIAVARCDIDSFLALGAFPTKGAFALGHEAVVEIVALGESVTGLETGQHAVVAFQLSCGTCRSCRASHSANCDSYPLLSDYGMQPLSGVEYGGMLSDLVSVPHANAMLQPISGPDPVTLASVSDNVLDGYRAVAPHLASRPGSDVLVVSHGYPSVPLYAVQAALALGASRVDFASDDEERLSLAERLGACPVRTDFQKPARRYPVVVEGGLTDEGLKYAIRATENEGICQSVSFYSGGGVSLPLGGMYTRGIRFFMGRAHAASLLPEVLPLVLSGKLRPEAVTTRVVGTEEAMSAWLEPSIKLVVQMDA